MKTVNNLLGVVVVIMALVLGLQGVCTVTDTVRGCTACTTGQSLVVDLATNLYTCSTTVDCIAVNSTSHCVQCIQTKTINLASATNLTDCLTLPGCLSSTDNLCTECLPTNYVLSSGTCLQTVIDYCWRINITTCLQCSDSNILDTASCSIPAIYCTTFDYQSWKCVVCPSGTTLHSSGVYCYGTISGCLVYQVGGCLQCQHGYYISGSSCTEGYSVNLEYQLVPADYYLSSVISTTLSICLSISQAFATSTCTTLTNNVSYCLTQISSVCTQCLPKFYLDTSFLCQPCSKYPYCINCDLNNCKQCQPDYYLAVDLSLTTITSFYSANSTTSVSSQCLPCSILGCQYCNNYFSDSGTNTIQCQQCLFGYSLYNYTCYKCPDGFYFNLTNKNCTACISNCQYCPSDPTACQQCSTGYYYNVVNGNCSNLTLFLSAVSLDSGNVFEVLNKSMPSSSTYIINNQKLLVTGCADISNGYVCHCPIGTTNNYTSLCQIIDTNLVTAALDSNALFGSPTTTLSKSIFIAQLRTLQLLSELPNFNFDYLPANATELLSTQQFATYIQIKINYIRNHAGTQATESGILADFALTRMNNVFDPYTATVLAGPGYYFKYSPIGMTTDVGTVVTTTFATGVQTAVLILFSNTDTVTQITGTVYIYQSAITTTTLNIKKINFLGSNQEYQVWVNGAVQTSATVSSDNQGYLTISNAPTSTTTTPNSIVVIGVTSATSGDIYSSQRIQNLIYRDSFIYIFVAITLYLILIPICALCDCVENKSSRRKMQQNTDSYKGIHQKTQSDQIQEESGSARAGEVLSINYKDFFPIYNIASTQRPKRLLKLCLFIVNLQHSVTFLVLIYFHLAAGQPLLAVILAIPAYLCTLIMGYFTGAATLKLPGKTKYLINLLSLAYWVLWVPVFNSFYSSQYKPYVYTFVIIFFIMDMLLDLLQTLLVYFTIKQQTKQMKMFQYLSKWLSYRGFYQFNQMAKDLEQVRDNQ